MGTTGGPVLLTLEEAAERLRLSPKTLRRMSARNELRLVRLGRSVRVPVSELDRLAAGRGVDELRQTASV